MDAIDAMELLTRAPRILEELDRASQALAPSVSHEALWLNHARALVESVTHANAELRAEARVLPELTSAREEHARALRVAWLDEVERLLAGIAFHRSKRDPIIEALFPPTKLDALGRASDDATEVYATDLERRLEGSYVKRMLETEGFAFALPVVTQVREALAAWRQSRRYEPPPPEVQEALRERLTAAAQSADIRYAQARLLLEAALLPSPGAFEALAPVFRPRRRPRPVAATPPSEAEGEVEVEVDLAAAGEAGAEAVSEPPSPAL